MGSACAVDQLMDLPMDKAKSKKWGIGNMPQLLLVLLSAPLWLLSLLGIALFVALHFIYGFLLHVAIWTRWCVHGRRVIFVYSNSPIWQDYVELNILPRLPDGSIILNWSERKKWSRWRLATRAFFFFGGSKEFNPVGMVFRPFCWGETFRFWKPFIEYKHGKSAALKKVEQDMFQLIGL